MRRILGLAGLLIFASMIIVSVLNGPAEKPSVLVENPELTLIAFVSLWIYLASGVLIFGHMLFGELDPRKRLNLTAHMISLVAYAVAGLAIAAMASGATPSPDLAPSPFLEDLIFFAFLLSPFIIMEDFALTQPKPKE
jgi:hypothetical protein